MVRHHIPLLRPIQELQDQGIRFYATIGVAVSLSAGLELTFLDIFQKATGLDRELAARILYQSRNTSLRRDIALEAMHFRLKNASDPRLETWNGISDRIVAATGNSGERNLISHMAVTRTAIHTGRIAIGRKVEDDPTFNPISEEKFFVEQDNEKVLAAIEKPKTATFDSLFAYCADLIKLLNEIDSFLARL